MEAILTGATGAVGSNLLRELLASPSWTRIVSLVRRPSGVLHPKLTESVVSMDALESSVTPAGAAFCTLGVGQPRKVSREEHWQVDVEYATAFARGCKA
ncbi:MAG: SDR family oxidoreductase, partial [Acidobacteriota bacterium]